MPAPVAADPPPAPCAPTTRTCPRRPTRPSASSSPALSCAPALLRHPPASPLSPHTYTRHAPPITGICGNIFVSSQPRLSLPHPRQLRCSPNLQVTQHITPLVCTWTECTACGMRAAAPSSRWLASSEAPTASSAGSPGSSHASPRASSCAAARGAPKRVAASSPRCVSLAHHLTA